MFDLLLTGLHSMGQHTTWLLLDEANTVYKHAQARVFKFKQVSDAGRARRVTADDVRLCQFFFCSPYLSKTDRLILSSSTTQSGRSSRKSSKRSSSLKKRRKTTTTLFWSSATMSENVCSSATISLSAVMNCSSAS